VPEHPPAAAAPGVADVATGEGHEFWHNQPNDKVFPNINTIAWAGDHSQTLATSYPLLVMDMYEHAYQMDFGVNATAYIDTFFRNINWEAVLKRIETARNDQPPVNEDPSTTTDMPSLSVEELAAQIANGSGVQIVDARQRDHMSRHVDLMAGATWRDPDRVEEWISDLTPDKPVAVYCAYGFDVGRNVTKTLIERGFDARFLRGGIAAWYASGGARAQTDGGIAPSMSRLQSPFGYSIGRSVRPGRRLRPLRATKGASAEGVGYLRGESQCGKCEAPPACYAGRAIPEKPGCFVILRESKSIAGMGWNGVPSSPINLSTVRTISPR